jgi:hypothetical protein
VLPPMWISRPILNICKIRIEFHQVQQWFY